MTKLVSSNLEGCEFFPESGVLTLEFKSGATYNYRNVPANVYHGLMAAESHGIFFHENIRDKFKYLRVS